MFLGLGRLYLLYFNAQGQAVSIGNYATNAVYHPNGLLKSHSYGNGTSFTQTLNSRLIPQDISDRRGNNYFINQTFGYDDNNNLLSLTDRINSAYNLRLAYDGLDRLETIIDSYSGSGYVDYDTLGNIEVKKVGNRTIDYHYNTQNQLTATSNGHVRNFTYDLVGNVLSNGVHTFDYNLEGNLITARSGGIVNHYLYDGNGMRVKTQDTLGTSYSFYGQNGKLMYRYVAGKHIDYIYLGGKLVARAELEDSLVSSCPCSYEFDSASNECLYSENAQMQCPSGQQNSGSLLNSRMYYQPFGEQIAGERDEVGYTGHKYDTSLNLSYMQARYYDPVIGRFYSNDPIGALGHLGGLQGVQGFNRYAYVNNNPYKMVDPDGRGGAYPGAHKDAAAGIALMNAVIDNSSFKAQLALGLEVKLKSPSGTKVEIGGKLAAGAQWSSDSAKHGTVVEGNLGLTAKGSNVEVVAQVGKFEILTPTATGSDVISTEGAKAFVKTGPLDSSKSSELQVGVAAGLVNLELTVDTAGVAEQFKKNLER